MKWIFLFVLSESIHCEKNMKNKDNVEFVTECGKKGQRKITGFGITVEANDREKAENDATKKAKNLTDLLSATSGCFSDCSLRSYGQIGGTETGAEYTFAYSIRNNAIVDISDVLFLKILNGDSPLNRQLGYLRKVRLASKSGDWGSVIKYLHEMPNFTHAGLKCLRNLLSHPKKTARIERCLKLNFPTYEEQGLWFDTNGEFDPTDKNNANFIKTHAECFLDQVHRNIRSAMNSPGLQ